MPYIPLSAVDEAIDIAVETSVLLVVSLAAVEAGSADVASAVLISVSTTNIPMSSNATSLFMLPPLLDAMKVTLMVPGGRAMLACSQSDPSWDTVMENKQTGYMV